MINEKIYLTTHSKLRFKQRTDLQTIDNQEQNAEAAFKNGYGFAQFKEPIFSFLKDLGYDSGGRYVPKIYNDCVYIFNNIGGHRLLTVYKVPEEYLPIEEYLIRDDELQKCIIMLTHKDTGEKFYGNGWGIADDIDEALEFTSQIKANNFINNNNQIKELKDDYYVMLI